MIQPEALTKADNGFVSTVLAEVPSFDNGGITLSSVNVQRGQTVVDARGELVTLKAGVTVRPSGCRETACAVTWDGESDLSMDQMSVIFRLADGLTWSDGTPVTAADSVFSFDLANDPAAPGLQWFESRTSSYSAVDEKTVVWTGKLGFTTSQLDRLFWSPLPTQLFVVDAGWETVSADARWSQPLPGYGPYGVTDWQELSITLERNSFSGLDDSAALSTDVVTVQVVSDPNDALTALEAGTCDILDQSYHFENDADALSAIETNPDVDRIIGQSGSWAQLIFGIKPASYDDFYNPIYGDRPNIFGDVRTRQAIASCLDRDAIRQAVYNGLAEFWPSFVTAGDSQLSPDQSLTYDPAQAVQLLEAVGWRDHDGDPATPLQAWYINNVPLGTELNLNLYVDQSPVRQVIAAEIQHSLVQCGVGVNVLSEPAEAVYAPGPDGPLFGRQFDLALLAWAPLPEADCALYESWQVPSQANDWIGTNIAGFEDSAYDAACSDAVLALPSAGGEPLGKAESAFTSAVPAIPLMSSPVVVFLRNGICPDIVDTWGISTDVVDSSSACH